jgi:ParB-like chromosome segregation protein Spo0J
MSPEAPQRVFSMIEVKLEEVVPNPRNPRFAPSKGQIRRMAASIKSAGQRTPISVRPLTEEEKARYPGKRWMCLGGHLRLLAATEAGVPTLLATVSTSEPADDIGNLLADNVTAPLHWTELCVGLAGFQKDAPKKQQREIADIAGIDQPVVSRYLNVAEAFGPELLAEIHARGSDGESQEPYDMPFYGAVALARIDDPAVRLASVREALAKRLSLKEIEELASHKGGGGDDSSGKAADEPKDKPPASSDNPFPEITDAFHKEAGKEAPEFFKTRRAKNGSAEVSVPGWLTATHATGDLYGALGKAIIAAAAAHPELATVAVEPSGDEEKLAQLKAQRDKVETQLMSTFKAGFTGQYEKFVAEFTAKLHEPGVGGGEVARQLTQLLPMLPKQYSDVLAPAPALAKRYGELSAEIETITIKLARERAGEK